MKSKYFLLPVLVLTAASFTACNDDDEYDFPGDPQTLVYTTDFSRSYKLVQTPAGLMGSISIPVTAKTNGRCGSDIKVTVAVDNSLIDAYNEENGTSYLPLPAEALVLDKTELTIPAGEMMSADTVKVSLTEDPEILKTLNDENGYIIPVRLASVSGGGAALAKSVKSISFLTIGISSDAIDHEGSLADSKGIPVEDWTGWSVTTNSNPNTGWEAMFNGDLKKVWYTTSNNEITLTVDMGKNYKFDAIQAKFASGYGTLWFNVGSIPKGTKIAISSDGSNWSNVGENTNTDNYRVGAQYVLFAISLEARYIRFVIPATGWRGASFQCGYFTVNAL